MNIKTRAKLLLTALAVLCAAGAVGGAIGHHPHPPVSHGPQTTAHNTCQAEDDPCWRSE